MKPARLAGIFTPNIVPLDARGEIDEPELRRYTDWLIQRGVHGLYPNGSTGEFTRFSTEDFAFSTDGILIASYRVASLSAFGMASLDPLEDGERGTIIMTSSVAAQDAQIGQGSIFDLGMDDEHHRRSSGVHALQHPGDRLRDALLGVRREPTERDLDDLALAVDVRHLGGYPQWLVERQLDRHALALEQLERADQARAFERQIADRELSSLLRGAYDRRDDPLHGLHRCVSIVIRLGNRRRADLLE